MAYVPPQQPVQSIQEQVQSLAEQAVENQKRAEEIGYRIDQYPQQGTSQGR